MIRLWAALACVLSILGPGRLHAQGCCTPGTSLLGGLTGGAAAPWHAEFGLASEAYELTQAYRGDEAVTDPAGRHSEVRRVLAWARLGLPGQMVLVVDLPFEHRMREAPQPFGAPGQMFRLTNNAPGDLSTSLMVHVAPRGRPRPWGIDAGVGVKWATASVERTQYGLRLPVELQSGTGSNDPLALASAYRSWSGAAATLAALARFPREGRNGYRYGTESHAVAAGEWVPATWWALGGEVRLRAAAADHFEGLGMLPNTGGWRLMVGPRARLEWRGAGLAMEGAFLWPAYQHLNGLQIGVDHQALLGARWHPS